jgi:hypothetical protein
MTNIHVFNQSSAGVDKAGMRSGGDRQLRGAAFAEYPRSRYPGPSGAC